MSESWAIITGKVQNGHKVASGQAENSPYPKGTINMQKPFFKALGLDLDSFYEGTLNISIAPYTFTLKNPEFTFPSVEWTDKHPPENFSFSRCKVIFNGLEYLGWVYYPDPSTKKAHFQNPSLVEVIAPLIPNIKKDDEVQLALNANEILLNDAG
jgi:hypothetical protein